MFLTPQVFKGCRQEETGHLLGLLCPMERQEDELGGSCRLESTRSRGFKTRLEIIRAPHLYYFHFQIYLSHRACIPGTYLAGGGAGDGVP